VTAPASSVVAVVERAVPVLATALDELAPRLLATTGKVSPDAKGDGTPVTEIDLEADERLGAALTSAFPGHGVLSEERTTVAPGTDFTWIVDPIDGTSNFTCGLPYWCVSVALAFEGEPVLGVIDAPVLARRYVARVGDGSHRDGHRLRIRERADWQNDRNRHVPVMLTTGTARRARGAGLRMNPRVMGSTALDLAVVAEGVAAASVALVPRVWDVAAGAVLVREAGGVAIATGGPSLLPLDPGRDYRDLAVTFAAGPDERYVRGLTAALVPGSA
jgi:myo-inositol-1(or 4)-monophosphatase